MKALKQAVKIFVVLTIILAWSNQQASAQTISLSSPGTGTVAIDSANVVYAIAGESGGIQWTQLVFTMTSGYYFSTYGAKVYTLTMKTNPFSKTFRFSPLNLGASSHPFTSADTSMLDGTYSVFARYKRSTGDTVRSNPTVTSIGIDCTALPPTLSLPASNSLVSSPVRVSYNIPESFAAASKKFIFSGPVIDTITGVNVVRVDTNLLIRTDSVKGTGIASSQLTSLPDGTYSVTLRYKDLSGHFASVTNTNVQIRTHTPAATLISPVSNGTYSDTSHFIYSIPVQPLAGSVSMVFRNAGGAKTISQQADNYGSTISFASSGTGLTSGIYDVWLVYRDALGNPKDSVIASNVTIDLSTGTPTLTSPASNAYISSPTTVNFTLPEAPLHGNVYLTFAGTGGLDSIKLKNMTAGVDSFTLDLKNLSASPYVEWANHDTVSSGYYTLLLAYQDTLGNAANFAQSTGVTIDMETIAPILSLPVPFYTGNLIPIQYTLPEVAASGSVKLILSGAGTADTLTMVDVTPMGVYYLDPLHIDNVSPVVSATAGSLPDGIYSIKLSYQDALGNPAASVTLDSITIDAHTQTPVLIAPTTGATMPRLMTFEFTIPESYEAGSLQLVFNYYSLLTTVVLADTFPVGTHTITLNAIDLSSSSCVKSASTNTLSPGLNTITLTYKDSLGNAAASAEADSVTLDEATAKAIIINPSADGTLTSTDFTLQYTLPETPTKGTVNVYLVKDTITCILSMNDSTAGTQSHQLDLHNLSASPAVTSTTYNSLPDGTYTVYASYQDALGNPTSPAGPTGTMILDATTEAPSIIRPVTAATVAGMMDIKFNLPEMYKPNSLKLVFDSAGVTISTLILANNFNAGADSLMLDANNLAGSPGVQSASQSSMNNGIYNITLLYQDTLNNAAASATVANVTLDKVTAVPVLTLPPSSSTVGPYITVDYTLPEEPKSGTVKLTFTGTTTSTVITLNDATSGHHGFTVSTANPALSTHVSAVTGDSLKEGVYSITLSYQDSLGNPAATVTNTSIMIDETTLAPVLTSPASSSTVGQFININFTIPENHTSNTLMLTLDSAGTKTFLTLADTFHVGTNVMVLNAGSLRSTPGIISITPSKNVLGGGIYTITLSYMDAFSNPTASITNNNITLDMMTQAAMLTSPLGAALIGGSNFVPVSFNLLEAPQAGSVTINFRSTSDTCSVIVNTSISGTASFSFNPRNLSATTGVTSATRDTLPDGFYIVTVTYQDVLGNSAATSNNGTMILDMTTANPVITSPASSGTLINLMNFNFTIPEKYSPNTLKLVFDHAGTKDTVVLANTFRTGADTLILESYNIRGSFQVQSSTTNSLSDGIYTITLSYQDSLGNPGASTTVSNITLDQVTTPPILISPTNVLQATSTMFNLQYTLPEVPFSGSVMALFMNDNTNCTIGLDESTAGNKNDLIDLKSLATSFAVSSHSCNSIDDGSYKVVVMYQDAFDNGVAVSDTGLLIIDTQTLNPSLILPGSNSGNTAMVDISFTLPEKALGNRVFVTFASATDTITIELATPDNAGLQTRTIEGDDLSSTSGFATSSQPTLPDGVYTLTVSYRDTLGNIASEDSQTNVSVSRITTGVRSSAEKNSINIYPNPNNGTFTIRSAKAGTYSIVDLLGNTIKTLKVNAESNNIITLDNINSGNYLLVSINNNEVIRQKLVIAR